MAMEFIQVSTLGHSVNHAFLFLAAVFCFYLLFLFDVCVEGNTHICGLGTGCTGGIPAFAWTRGSIASISQ